MPEITPKINPVPFVVNLTDVNLDVESIGWAAHTTARIFASQKKDSITPTFIITTAAHQAVSVNENIRRLAKELTNNLSPHNAKSIERASQRLQRTWTTATLPKYVERSLVSLYVKLAPTKAKVRPRLTLRPSAAGLVPSEVGEIGQYETITDISNERQFLAAVRRVWASVYSESALTWRLQHGHDPVGPALAIAVQTTPAPTASTSSALPTGYLYTIDPLLNTRAIWYAELSKANTPEITATFRMFVSPDRTPTVIESTAIMFAPGIAAAAHDLYFLMGESVRVEFVVTEQHKIQLTWVVPWPTRVPNPAHTVSTYTLKKNGPVVATGAAYGRGMAAGAVHTLSAPARIQSGEIMVVPRLTAAWEQSLHQAAGVIVEDAHISGYAAALLRELGIPAVVGVPRARTVFKKIPTATIACETSGTGTVYQGILPFEVHETAVPASTATKTQLYTTVTQIDRVADVAATSAAGVGLLPMEFLWSQTIGIHPLALLAAPRDRSRSLTNQIKEKINYPAASADWAATQLATGIARVAAAFYPRPVWVRLSNFASDEFAGLVGGDEFETPERNPHLGRRGASRYLDQTYQPAFALECAVLKRVRSTFGLTNVQLVVPFCRTPEEGAQVLALLEKNGLTRGEENLHIQVAGDIPANVVLAGEFMSLFDGIHLDINDITKNLFATDDPAHITSVDLVTHRALKPWLHEVLKAARAAKKPTHVWGDNLTQSPDLVNFLLRERVTSLTFPADSLPRHAAEISYIEKTVGRTGRRTSTRALSLVIGLGALAVGLLSVGAGCERAYAPLPTTAATESVSVAQLRARWEARLNEALAHRDAATAAELTTLKVSSFADFTLHYPRPWSAEYWAGGVTLTAADSPASDYVSVFRQVLPHTRPADAVTDAVTVENKPAVHYTVPLAGPGVLSGATLTIYELNLPDGEVLEINGTNASTTAAVFSSIKMGNRAATAAPGYTKWDLRERRWCAAVATFAQESKNTSCLVYANSCAVPKGWTVCD